MPISLHSRLLTDALAGLDRIAAGLSGRHVMVVGASGFLASNLIAFLDALKRQYAIRLSISASGRRAISGAPFWQFMNCDPEVAFQQAGVETTKLPPGAIVVHAASYGAPGDYLREPTETFRANTEGVYALIRQHSHSHIAHFVYVSSAEIYGQPPPSAIPTPETYVGGLSTTDARSIYGESKRMGEVLATSLCAEYGIPLTILRPWNVYGPGQRYDDSRVPMQIMRQCIETGKVSLQSDGSPTRSFCYAWDGILQIAAALSEMPSQTSVYNIGNGKAEISIAGLAGACLASFGLNGSNLSKGSGGGGSAIQRSCPDVTRVVSRIPAGAGFVSLETGLRCLNEWALCLRNLRGSRP